MQNRIKSKRLNYSELFSITAEIYKKNIKTITFVSFFIIIPLFLFTQWVQEDSGTGPVSIWDVNKG